MWKWERLYNHYLWLLICYFLYERLKNLLKITCYHHNISAVSGELIKLCLFCVVNFIMFMDQRKMQAYWRRNLKYLAILLSVWFLGSYGCGILFADTLNQIRIGGFKLGFWFAQQGSIYIFIILIFIYVILMNKLDREFDVNED